MPGIDIPQICMLLVSFSLFLPRLGFGVIYTFFFLIYIYIYKIKFDYVTAVGIFPIAF